MEPSDESGRRDRGRNEQWGAGSRELRRQADPHPDESAPLGGSRLRHGGAGCPGAERRLRGARGRCGGRGDGGAGAGRRLPGEIRRRLGCGDREKLPRIRRVPGGRAMNVVLIGFSGTGKSTVGELLAKRLGWEFVDTDERVELAAGKPIHRIFAENGQAAFRTLEREAVEEALQGSSRVVSVGGGAVVDPASRKRMRDGNLVLLLDAEASTLYRRLATAVVDEPRPMLSDPDPLARITALKANRDPLYREVAHSIVSTEGLDPEGVVVRIVSSISLALDGQPMMKMGVE